MPKSTADRAVNVETGNVTAFTLEMASGGCPLDPGRPPVVTIDGQKINAPAPMSDRSWRRALREDRR